MDVAIGSNLLRIMRMLAYYSEARKKPASFVRILEYSDASVIEKQLVLVMQRLCNLGFVEMHRASPTSGPKDSTYTITELGLKRLVHEHISW